MKLSSSVFTRVNTGEASLVMDVKRVNYKITFQFFEERESEDIIRMSKNN